MIGVQDEDIGLIMPSQATVGKEQNAYRQQEKPQPSALPKHLGFIGNRGIDRHRTSSDDTRAAAL
jgi:hypothetical protein